MPKYSLDIAVYVFAFVMIWIGSGLIVSAISKLSHRLKIPPFLVSFLVLGMLTSTPEMAVGFSSVLEGKPSIFVGNLLGGVPVLFLFVIPILAIVGGGIRLTKSVSKKSILISLIISIAPFITILDQKITSLEGVALVVIYLSGLFFMQKETLFRKGSLASLEIKSYSLLDLLKVIVGTGLVLAASNLIVSKTIYFSEVFHITPFYISLVILSLGTNLPELSLAVRTAVGRKKDIAIGDYLGSASANTFLFGVFTLMTKGSSLPVNNFLVMFALVTVGLLLFYKFATSEKKITPKEALILLGIYVLFVFLELRQY